MLCWCNAAGAGMEWSFPSLSKRVEFQLCSICPISRALAYSSGCSLFRPFSDISVGFQHFLSLGLCCAWLVIQVSSAGSTWPLETWNTWLLQPVCSWLDELCREQLASAQDRNQLGALQCPP